ncbi:acidic leucine-rich nuclear phosphoprotein 32 family member B-like [Quercus lobata]|uniref:acidic leucine-rich nuclear phosphoprotein 32 family member B-like n=1 Tax=Quercus lobata TaxID=97700 RepID=UPI0012440E8A|nr:acidic leucine-rich nuclear phosphoprotein 32 family member B-like [Quercus lobata]
MPQVNAAKLYVSSEPLAEVDTEEVQQSTTSLQFIALDDGCTIMRSYTMGSYMLPSQDYAANTSETLQPQETHLGEEDEDKDEDEDEDEDYTTNNGENIDDMDEYEERIERDDFDRDVDDHELVPNFEEEIMEYHDKGDADDDIGIQHDTNTTTAYTPPVESFYANIWKDMVDSSCL